MNKVKKQKVKRKEKYKIKNWRKYNESLKKRGDITVWFSEDVEKQWNYQGIQKPGGEVIYSDTAIEFCLIIRSLFRLPYRQTEGLIKSLLKKMSKGLLSPSYTQLNRRSKKLKIDIRRQVNKGSIDIVVDSTGLKVYGEGEWKVRKHGASKRRTWRKLHISVDAKSSEILSVELTENSSDDASQVQPLLENIQEEVKEFIGDGGYDKYKALKELNKREIKGIIPPQRNAVCKKEENPVWSARNKVIRKIKKSGRKRWKKQEGYHRRSLAEVTIYRYKTILGSVLQSRKIEYEKAEVRIKCKILNCMTNLGMPVSYKVS